MIERKIDELGRIVVPSEMRDALGIQVKTPVEIELEGDRITLRKAKCTCRLCGSANEINSEFGICADCIAKIKSI